VRVIATAGHVDHGKSTLVHALSGINPDRLKEEQEREMTIDLGFAWLTLPSGESVGIVDVPGHIDFIENMLAGVGGVDAALLVVAADEGVMLQTHEHLAILDLLKVQAGVVALTKRDLVDDEWLELVTADVSATLEGTSLAGAPIIPVSARTRAGIPQLLVELDRVLAASPPRPDRGRPRLSVDRVFTVAGFGTVVTGTLVDGSLAPGQEVTILPRGLTARVRGLQTHKKKIERAVPGSRVAVNLSGVELTDVRRGDVVTTPGWLVPTQLVDTHFQLLADAPKPLRHNSEVKVFHGAAEVTAQVRLLGDDQLVPGAEGWVQFRLNDPLNLVKGDRFIVRLPSPSITLGGGTVVDTHPTHRHRRFKPEVIAHLETLARGSPSEVLLQALDAAGPTAVADLLKKTNLAADMALPLLAEWIVAGDVLVLGSPLAPLNTHHIVISHRAWASLTAKIADDLRAYHATYALRPGMPREELKSKLGFAPKTFNDVVVLAATQGLLVEFGAFVRASDFSVKFTPDQQRAIDSLLARFHSAPYATPSVKESEAAVGEDVLAALLEQGKLVKVSDEVLFLPQTYTAMVERIKVHIQQNGTHSVTVAQVRDLFDTSRKYALALLEYLDAKGVTKRVGDERVLR
jgi:selenocysteine-specific elongation factor